MYQYHLQPAESRPTSLVSRRRAAAAHNETTSASLFVSLRRAHFNTITTFFKSRRYWILRQTDQSVARAATVNSGGEDSLVGVASREGLGMMAQYYLRWTKQKFLGLINHMLLQMHSAPVI